MESNYYLQISCYEDDSIYSFALYDEKEKRRYCGEYIVGEAFDDYQNSYYENHYLDRDNDFILLINEQNFLNFKKLNFSKQIKFKNINKLLIEIGLEEHGI